MAEGTRINTFVFMDLETTGLKKKGVFPEITELFMLSVGQEEFMLGNRNKVENSIKLIFKTETITERASKITGLTADRFSDQEIFNVKTFELLNLFLSRLKKPVCLLAHNGKRFDFAVLKDKLDKIGKKLMPDLLCADTLEAFRNIDKCITKRLENLSLRGSPEDSCTKSKISYSLEEIYKRKISTKKVSAHRAECDVKMMYEIALKDKNEFQNWVNEKATKFNKEDSSK